MADELRRSEIWRGTYREVDFEVVRWELGGEAAWNYYIRLAVARVPAEERHRFVLPPSGYMARPNLDLPYYPVGSVPDIEWHCGCTYYEKQGGADGGALFVKMGCDYAHAYDQGCEYTLDMIADDARGSIDALWGMFPKMLHVCSYNGGLYAEDEGTTQPGGAWLSHAGAARHAEWQSKREGASDGQRAE